MSDTTITPNMNLIVPIVGVDAGPDWANNINASLGILDQHSHVPGQGVQITPAGMNINVDLPINSNNLTLVKTVNFKALVSTLAGASPNLGCIYVAGNELIYNDEAGNVVPITKTGSVNAGAGSITGLPSGTASASYSSGSGTFVWQSATNTAANMDGASFIFREQVASAKGVTVSSPTALAADYQMFWPAALPASQKFMTLDSSGNIAAPWIVDNSTIVVSSNIVQVPASGIGTTQIAAGAVTRPKQAAVGQQVSSSSGSFSTSSGSNVDVTNLSVTITTTGRPVVLTLIQAQAASTQAYLAVTLSNQGELLLLRGATVIADMQMEMDGSGTNLITPLGSFFHIDVIGAGTYTYKVQAAISGGGTLRVNQATLFAYEL